VRSGILFLMLFFLTMFRELKNLLEPSISSAGFAFPSLNATDIRQPFCEEGIHVSYFVYTHPKTPPHQATPTTIQCKPSFHVSLYHLYYYIGIESPLL
jgi:hypothetical protein